MRCAPAKAPHLNGLRFKMCLRPARPCSPCFRGQILAKINDLDAISWASAGGRVSQLVWERLIAAVRAPFESLIAPQSSFNLFFLALTLAFCAGIYAANARRPLRLRTLRRFLLPRRVFLHASAKLDYKYYIVAAALRAGMLGSMIVSSALMATGMVGALNGIFGAFTPIAAPPVVI